MSDTQFPEWSYRVVSDDEEEWIDIGDCAWFEKYDAAREASEHYYDATGGAAEWAYNVRVEIEVRSPKGEITKHEIWWDAEIAHEQTEIVS